MMGFTPNLGFRIILIEQDKQRVASDWVNDQIDVVASSVPHVHGQEPCWSGYI
jgi:hypothetical protein